MTEPRKEAVGLDVSDVAPAQSVAPDEESLPDLDAPAPEIDVPALSARAERTAADRARAREMFERLTAMEPDDPARTRLRE